MSESNLSPDQQKLLQLMLEEEVLRFGEFKTKSGRLSPFFINTGAYDSASALGVLGELYAKAIHAAFGEEFDFFFGPAYKGIPLATAVGTAFHRLYGVDKKITFDRKEAKDHGEGGHLIGYRPTDNDRCVIVEDVTTAGTSVHNTAKLLSGIADVKLVGLIVSVDRQERGNGETTALRELELQYGLKSVALLSLEEMVPALHNVTVSGKVWIDDDTKERIDAYRNQYGARV